MTHENLTTSHSSIGDRLRVLGPPVSRFSRKHERACRNSHYASSVMQRCSCTRTFSSFPRSPMPFVLLHLSPILLPPWLPTTSIPFHLSPRLPSPLSPDHPPLVTIQGHGEQMLSIPVAGTSRIDSCYLFSLHPGYECCPRTPRHLFRLLPGFESTWHLACASRHSASFVTSTPDSVFESGQGGSDTAPLSMYTPSWRSFRAECIFRAVFFA